MSQNAYPILRLKSGREKSILNQHPWIFSGAVKTHPQAESGEIIAVQSQQGKPLGYGFYDSQSQIVCRLFAFEHPIQRIENPNPLEEEYWIDKIRRAYQLRQTYLDLKNTNAYRLIHAEGDFFPGLIVDVYDQVAVLQLLIKGTENIHTYIQKGIQSLGIPYIYLKMKESTQRLESTQLSSGWLTEPFPETIQVKEYGLSFKIDVEKGQKTGFFLDQRESRLLLQHYAQDKKILNAFSYTGGFSVYALQGGAKTVHSVDISKDAIAMGDKNIHINFGENAAHESVAEDCFDYLKKSQEEYDIIVLDPPAFAKNKRAVANASRGYMSLNELGLKRLKKGGLLFTFSCSGSISRDLFRKIIFTAAAEVGRRVRIIHQLTQPIDHPVNIYHPEGEYLKGLALYVE